MTLRERKKGSCGKGKGKGREGKKGRKEERKKGRKERKEEKGRGGEEVEKQRKERKKGDQIRTQLKKDSFFLSTEIQPTSFLALVGAFHGALFPSSFA